MADSGVLAGADPVLDLGMDPVRRVDVGELGAGSSPGIPVVRAISLTASPSEAVA
jgi:hypothetical protein